MSFIPDKPSHRKFAFRHLNSTQYKTYAKQYSRAKAGEIRFVYAWLIGNGVYELIQAAGKGIVVNYAGNYGKHKLVAFCLTGGIYLFLSPALVVLTNGTKFVSIGKSIHSLTAFIFECVEDLSNLSFAPIDFLLFGQPIPIGASNRFNLFKDL